MTAAAVDLHRCQLGPDCHAATIENGQRHPAHTEHPDTVCATCSTAITHAVGDLANIWHMLNNAIGDRTRRGGQKVTTSRSAPININTDVDALKTAIVEWLVIATARISEQLNIDDPQPLCHSDTEHARIVTTCLQILTPNIDMLLALPEDDIVTWATENTDYAGESVPHTTDTGTHWRPNTEIISLTGLQIALRLVDLRRKARALLALTNPEDKLSTPCPGCDQRELRRHHEHRPNGRDIDQIDCGNCGLNWPYDRYRHLCLIWVKDDEMEREKLQAQLDTEKARRQLAEWLLAKREWQLSLALDCPDVTAADFAETILTDPAIPEPGPDDYMTDKDIAALAGVAVNTIRSWASRGHITRHTADDGSTLYLAAEVWEHAKTVAGGRNATKRRLTTTRKALTCVTNPEMRATLSAAAEPAQKPAQPMTRNVGLHCAGCGEPLSLYHDGRTPTTVTVTCACGHQTTWTTPNTPMPIRPGFGLAAGKVNP
jgi:hypothetical protein